MENKRSSFTGKLGFVLAAAGSAVGLGNIWRFPYLAAKYGGGMFLLTYIVLAVTFGFTLMVAEISLGRKTQLSAISAFSKLDKRFSFLGYLASIVPVIILPYYSVIGGWVTKYLYVFASGGMQDAVKDDYFTNFISTPAEPVGWFLIFMALTAIIVLLGVEKGVEKVSKVMMPVLVVLTLFVAIYAMFMPGAMEGVKYYLTPDFSKFSATTVLAAMGQVFYSMSVMMAIMIAYGSFLDDSSNIARDGIIIAFSDLAVSLLSGIVMFTTMYGTGLQDMLATKSGPGLAFGVYPTAIVNLSKSGVFNAIFAFVFYFCLCTLAIDSAFSLVEGISTAFSDKFGTDKKKTTITLCVIAGVISLVYTTGAGLAVLDIVDNWCNSFTLILIGVLETIAIGWFFKTSKVVKEINRNSKKFKMPRVWFDIAVKFVAPVSLTVLFVWNIIDLFKNKGGIYGAADGYNLTSNILAGWLVFALCLVRGFVIPRFKGKNKQTETEETWED